MASKIDIVVQAVDNLSATMKKIESNLAQFSRNASNSMRQVENSSRAMSTNTVASVNKLNVSFRSLTVTLRRMGAIVGSIYAVRSAIQGITSLTDDFIALNEGMAMVNTIAQKDTESINQLTNSVIELSTKTGKPAEDLARGLYDIYSSGFEGAQAMDVLEEASEGAIAGFTETKTSAQILMTAMNAYNKKTAPEMKDISDTLFKVVDRGIVTYKELAQQLGTVMAAAAPLGVDLNTIGAGMAQLTKHGIDAAEAATSLEALMRSILKPTSDAKDAAKKLGLQWNTEALEAKGLGGMLTDLYKATAGNETAMSKVVPELRAFRSVMVLAADGGVEFAHTLDTISDHAGAMDKALSKAEDSVAQRMRVATAEWVKYKNELVESLTEVEIGFIKTAANVAKFISENVDSFVALLKVIRDLTVVFTTFWVVSKIYAWIEAIAAAKAAIVALSLQAGSATVAVNTLKLALTPLMGLGIVLAIAIPAYEIVLSQINKLKNAWVDLANSRGQTADMITDAAKNLRSNVSSDLTYIQDLKKQAQEKGNNEEYARAVEQENKIIKLKELTNEKLRVLATRDSKGKDTASIPDLNNQIVALKKEISSFGDVAWKSLGSLSSNITAPEMDLSSSPVFGMGSDELDDFFSDASNKTADTIKKISKDISDYYADLDDYTNDYIKTLNKQSDALEEQGLKYSRYLEDINTDLSRTEEAHKTALAGINEDIRRNNVDFAENMDDRLKKFNDTMNEMRKKHGDTIEDLQHDIELEKGFGLRADQEKLKELEKRLARENRDYAEKTADEQEQYNEDIADYTKNNDEKLADFQDRLDAEQLAYDQKIADTQLAMEREAADYAKSQDDILAKTNETLQGIVDSYQNAFSAIYDKIRDSGVPDLLAMLPELMNITGEKSISGVSIDRNLGAEQEFVKNWGGLYGRLPNAEEISLGVYGTKTGPNTSAGVNVTINNPVVSNAEMLDQLYDQLVNKVGKAIARDKRGA